MDLDWTDGEWNTLFQKMGMLVCSYNELRELQRKYRKQRCEVKPYFDIYQYLSNWSLTDVVYRHDTDDAGNIYVDITDAGAGNYTVSLYNDDSWSVKVAEGTGAPGATVTLVAETGYTVNGSVYLESDVSVVTGTIFLKVVNDYRRRIYDEYGQLRQFEADMRSALDAQFFNIGGSILNLSNTVRSASDAFLLNYLANVIQSGSSRIDSKRLEFADDGSASIDWGRSILTDLADAMTDNDETNNIQYVGRNTTSTGTIVEDEDNTGEVEKISVKCDELNWVPNGKLIIECIEEGVGAESFDLTFFDDDQSTYRSCRTGFALKTQYIELLLGIKLGLQATYGATGALSSDTSDYYTDGESETNSDSGDWYVDYVHATKLVNIYSDSAKENLVAQGTWNTTPGSTVTCAEQNGSGLTATLKITADPAANKSMTLTINRPMKGDKWYIDYTNAFDNVWSTFFGEVYQYELPDSGDHEIPQELACKFHYPELNLPLV